MNPTEKDKLFNKAVQVVVKHQQASASLLQRKLIVGYQRACQLIDQLELAGYVGSFESGKVRKVLIKDLKQMK